LKQKGWQKKADDLKRKAITTAVQIERNKQAEVDADAARKMELEAEAERLAALDVDLKNKAKAEAERIAVVSRPVCKAERATEGTVVKEGAIP